MLYRICRSVKKERYTMFLSLFPVAPLFFIGSKSLSEFSN